MRLALALALALVACKRPDAKQHTKAATGAGDSWGGAGASDGGVVADDRVVVPAGSLVEETIAAWYVVLTPSPPPKKLLAALGAEAQKLGLVLGGEPPARWAEIDPSTPADEGVGGDDHLLRRMSPEGEAALALATGAISIGAGAASAELDAIHAALVELVGRATRDGDLVLDVQTGTIFDLAMFDLHALAPRDAIALTAFYVDPEPGAGGLSTVETGGMERFALPDLRISHVPRGLVDQLDDVLDASSQVLIDHGGLTADGMLEVDVAALSGFTALQGSVRDHDGTGRIRWRVTWVEDDEEEGRVIELEPMGPGDATARLGIALDTFYGIAGLGFVEFDLDTPEVHATTAQVQRDLLALRDRFVRGVPDGEALRVFAPFPRGDDQYFLWIEITRSKTDGWLRGTIVDSPPKDVDFVLGQQVDVPIADVIDYKHEQADGTTVGPLQAFDAED